MKPEKLKLFDTIKLRDKPTELLPKIKLRAELPKSDKLQECINNAKRNAR